MWINPIPIGLFLSNIDCFPPLIPKGSVIHVYSPTFQCLVIKKIRPLSLKVRVQGSILKKIKKYVRKMFNFDKC